MSTTRANRTKPTEWTWSNRTKPLLYIELLQDNYDSVQDLDWEDIYVLTSTGIPVCWTTRNWRTPI